MSELLKPPAVPVAILNFFASQPDFPAVAGDISEEFHQRIQSSGPKAAKRWYWGEQFRNAGALTARELSRTPVRTTLMALSCFFAVAIVTNILMNYLWSLGLMYGPRPRGVLTIQLLTLLATGLAGGKVLPGREWALALSFTAFSICLAGGLRWYSAVPRVHFSAPQLEFLIVGNVLCQGAFWLGCVLVRYANNRKHSSIVSTAKSA